MFKKSMLKKQIIILISSIISLILTTQNIFSAPYITLDLTYDYKTYKYQAEEIYIKVNDEKLENLIMPPIISNDFTLIPAREVFQIIGANVSWINETQEVKVEYENNTVLIYINSDKAIVNNKEYTMDIQAKIINNKTMIPLRFVAEALGFIVDWNSKTRTVSINTNKSEIITETTTETTTNNTLENSNSTTNNYINLPEESHQKVSIDNVIIPENDIENFIIKASGKISKVNTFILDGNRLVIDIYNAENNLKEKKYLLNNNSNIESIRIAQNQTSPNLITRVVLELKTLNPYSLFFENDRSTIILSFNKTEVNEISLSTDENGDIFTIKGNYPMSNAYKNNETNKLYIDLKNSNLNYTGDILKNGKFVSNVKYYNLSDNSIRIECDLIDEVSITVKNSTNFSEVSIKETNLKNISYNSEERTISLKKNGAMIDTNAILHTDNYIEKIYTLSFNTDLSNIISDNNYEINDGYINNFFVKTENNTTKIIINENRILAFVIEQDDDYVYIKAKLPKNVYKNIVVIDPGHGGSDTGTIGNGLYEKNINLDISNRLIDLFSKDSNIKAYASRTTDVYPSFDDRTSLGNEVGDLFISIHNNSGDKIITANGTEVYYLTPNDQGSGLTSLNTAKDVQSKLISSLSSYDRRIKKGDYKVLRDSKIPAILCEIGFLSNKIEAKKLSTPEYRQKAAQAIYEACKGLFTKYPSIR